MISADEKFKVVALSLGGRGNKIFHSGDVVLSAELTQETTILIRDGYIVPYEDCEPVAEETEEELGLAKEKADKMPTLLDKLRAKKHDEPVPEYEEITKSEIKKKLTEDCVDYSEKWSKRTLYDLCYNTEKKH